MKKRLSALSNEQSNTSDCDKEMFFQIYSPRLIEKSGTDTSYLFDKYIDNLSLDAENSTIVEKLETPKVPSVYDKGYQFPAKAVKPENSIILYKIINPEDIISRCTVRNTEQRSFSRDTSPMVSAVSRPSISRKFPNLGKSPIPWEREQNRLSRISSAKKHSSRSPIVVTEDRVKNGKVEFFIRGHTNNLDASQSKPRLASISKGKLKIIRNREFPKEPSFNRSLLQQAAHETTAEVLNKPKDNKSSKIKLPSSWKSKSVKTLEQKSSEIQRILKKSSPIKLIYSNTSISVKAKKF
jgi:hypothetical protein